MRNSIHWASASEPAVVAAAAVVAADAVAAGVPAPPGS